MPLSIDLTRPLTPEPAELKIPPCHLARLLPCPGSSILTLLAFNDLPGLGLPLPPELIQLERWTSNEAPEERFDVGKLLLMSLPPRALVEELLRRIVSFDAPTTTLPRLPLWVLTYWSEAHQCRELQEGWACSKGWASRMLRGSLEARRAHAEVVDVLGKIFWDEDLFGRGVACGRVTILSSYLSNQQLTGNHIYQLTHMLRVELDALSSSRSLVVDLEFVELLVKAAASEHNIEFSKEFRMLHDVELDLKNGFKDGVGGLILDMGIPTLAEMV